MKKIIFLLICIILLTGCESKIIVNTNPYYKVIKETNNLDFFNVIEHTRYGKYYNLKVVLPDDFDSAKELTFVIKDSNNEYTYPLINNGSYLTISNYINDGVLLEKIVPGKYVMMVRETKDNDYKYYHLFNSSSYSDLDYYTFTKNNSNNYIQIAFDNYKDYNFLKMDVQEKKMPDNYYDIILDPGHGGKDSGATNGKIHEADFNLKYAKLIRDELENKGLRVKLTREDDIDIETYGYGSRTGIPYETKAKLMISVHQNSDTSKNTHGIEVYTAFGDKLDFAYYLASHIANNTTSGYSNKTTDKVMDGVYTRTYTENDIKRNQKSAKKEGWDFYNIEPNSVTYYYFIRETGGILTKAFADGRNKKYQANPYYQENYGAEAYLLEMAYVSNKSDIGYLESEQNSYLTAIVDSINYYVNN